MHPITLQISSLHNTNKKDELFLNLEDHSMGRTISPAANDSPLSKNDSSLNNRSNHSRRRFQIAQKLLTQILDHASRSRGELSTVPVKLKLNTLNKLSLTSTNETPNPSIVFNSKNYKALFIYHLHPFNNPSPTFTLLNQLIISLYKLAQNCPHVKSNSVYARKTTMNPEILEADNE
ncbi:hypothetical protein O181_113359 [Austropuccinia psidii MF-1]|uniref:Uncharacterized protein n=1 Tax=Austropuccinia psidii MF-1 TaxID=1389203 RepID=A0A9Q3K3F8_9BASI|nr:hypothetical protein [Austropuccinia psidii MF-1]